MKFCKDCQNVNVKPTSSILTRLLLSTYLFAIFYFFTGTIDEGAFVSLIPLIIPYACYCPQCKRKFYKLLDLANINSYWNTSILDIYTLIMLPSILTITTLIFNFPYTGLGRIVYLPTIFLINSMVIIVSLYISRGRNKTLNTWSWVIIILLTVILSVLMYPQDSGEGIIKLIWESLRSE